MPRQPIIIAPSLLAADFGRLREEALSVQAAGAEWLHLDIMDGHFVPNISFGPVLVAALRPHLTMKFDVHLMIEPADPYLEAFARAGADHLIVHPESGPHLHRTLQAIAALGCRAGVAVNPATPLAHVEPVLDLIDTVLVMTVNPGFGGQAFLESQLPRIRALRTMLDQAALDQAARPIRLGIDGGVDLRTAPLCLAAGADTLIAGTSVFREIDRAATIAALRGAG